MSRHVLYVIMIAAGHYYIVPAVYCHDIIADRQRKTKTKGGGRPKVGETYYKILLNVC